MNQKHAFVVALIVFTLVHLQKQPRATKNPIKKSVWQPICSTGAELAKIPKIAEHKLSAMSTAEQKHEEIALKLLVYSKKQTSRKAKAALRALAETITETHFSLQRQQQSFTHNAIEAMATTMQLKGAIAETLALLKDHAHNGASIYCLSNGDENSATAATTGLETCTAPNLSFSPHGEQADTSILDTAGFKALPTGSVFTATGGSNENKCPLLVWAGGQTGPFVTSATVKLAGGLIQGTSAATLSAQKPSVLNTAAPRPTQKLPEAAQYDAHEINNKKVTEFATDTATIIKTAASNSKSAERLATYLGGNKR
uniref:Variant surface glycoprotein 1125.5415 n=1 Tax=Trypanosoma brucei TaxID=5691 RepID=A0A1J0RC31_9TRYP|nr:variant surface glycoprotein 1125.5415 [Trypanosoma brucei]